jgi:hypothetical protein
MEIKLNISDSILDLCIISLIKDYINGNKYKWVSSIQYKKDSYCNISNPSWFIIITDTNNNSHNITLSDVILAIQLLFHDKPQIFCNIITGNNNQNSIDMLFQYTCYKHSFYNK